MLAQEGAHKIGPDIAHPRDDEREKYIKPAVHPGEGLQIRGAGQGDGHDDGDGRAFHTRETSDPLFE